MLTGICASLRHYIGHFQMHPAGSFVETHGFRCPNPSKDVVASQMVLVHPTWDMTAGSMRKIDSDMPYQHKVHAVVARSTFPSQNVQNTPAPDDFWKLRCRKSARRCGAKHISKSKCAKHRMFAPLLEVQMSKKCTPLWREANFQVKMYKAHHVRTIFGGSDVVSRGRRKGLWTLSKVSKT